MLDYTIIYTSTTGFTFDSLTTFLITSTVNISGGPVIFQAGTVIKYDVPANNPSLNLLSGITLNWQGTPYRPVVLTARRDHSVGQPITVPSGTLSGFYASTALKLDNLGAVTLTNLSVRHAALGIETTGNTALTLRHAQFVNCGTGVKNGLAVTLQNALFHNVANVLWQTGSTGSTGEFLTVDSAQYANYATGGGILTLKNSILASVANPNTGVTPPGTFIATLPIFATAGSGAHYLDLDSSWVQARTAIGTIAAPLLAELPGMTVRPPGQLPAAVTADLTLSALSIAEGTDSTKWRWGYHYWPVHYLAPGTTVTGATVTPPTAWSSPGRRAPPSRWLPAASSPPPAGPARR